MQFVTFPQLTVLEINGLDAGRVLNNVCTAAVLQLASGDGCETFITDVRGRTLGHVCAYRDQDRIRLIGAPGQAPVIAAHIDRYTIREDAVTSDLSEQWSGLLVQPDRLRQVAPQFEPASPVTPHALWWRPLAVDSSSSSLEGIAVYQVPWTADVPCDIPAPCDIQGFLLAAGPASAVQQLATELERLGAAALEDLVFHTARVAGRFPWFGIDLDDRNLPQEADRDASAISFTKGCYLGQETIARLDALGQVQKKLVLWRIQSAAPPAVATELTSNDRVVGRLTSVVPSPDGNGFLALGFARRSHFESGAQATCKQDGDVSFTAVVV